MRATIIGLPLLSVLAGCGGDGGSSSECPVFVLRTDGLMYSGKAENTVNVYDYCISVQGYRVQYQGLTPDMTLYIGEGMGAKKLSGDQWRIDGDNLVILGEFKSGLYSFSASYGCTAKKFEWKNCGGPENADLKEPADR